MDTSTVISASALAFSIVSFSISLYERRARSRVQEALLDLQRDSSFENRLAEWPNALKFHGIDLKAARKERIAAQDIAYLVLSVGALCAYCTARSVPINEYLKESDYRQRMFAQTATRRTWKYARLCFSNDVRDSIEKYIKETHGETYAS